MLAPRTLTLAGPSAGGRRLSQPCVVVEGPERMGLFGDTAQHGADDASRSSWLRRAAEPSVHVANCVTRLQQLGKNCTATATHMPLHSCTMHHASAQLMK